MDQKPLGLLTIHIKRGINLAIRDHRSSDPYVVITVADQVPFLPSSYLVLKFQPQIKNQDYEI
ncbi:hypothetical protein F2Q69_00024185 [Brassica cretica]|uniref:C2 domain-containing protein n=1 Tax=Brassica cretica TaxID=69181 RepID=A0A8S9Q5U3_BRACR|nr:hypothetical protein F2Q69_00024185 [Brassica cretica]